jgi:hypothetical protein
VHVNSTIFLRAVLAPNPEPLTFFIALNQLQS